MRANHEPTWVTMKTGKGDIDVFVKPGQFIFGRDSAARELRMKSSSVRNRMEKLKNIQNLDIQADNQYSMVSIVNWDIYQPHAEAIGQPIGQAEDNQRTTKGQPKDTEKNDKNDKNKNIQQESVISDNGKHDKALRLYKAYIDLCDPTHDHRSRSRCISNLTYYLDRFSVDDLQAAIRAYSQAKRDSSREFIKDPANFFGKKDPTFADYLPKPESEADTGWKLN